MCVSQFAAVGGDTALGSLLISRGAGGPKCGGPKHMALWGREVPCSLAAFLNNPLLFPRCVSDRQRSFALGIQWIVVRTLGMQQSEWVWSVGFVERVPNCYLRIKHVWLEKEGVGHMLLKGGCFFLFAVIQKNLTPLACGLQTE